MRIVIFGASGATGVHLVQQALAEGHHVTAFTRHKHKLGFHHPRLHVMIGDVSSRHTVEEAVSGQDAVISALGAQSIFQLDRTINDGVASIVKSMAIANVQRLIYLSTMGVAATRKRAGTLIGLLSATLLRNEITGHEIRELMIQKTTLQWTIVRAPILNNGKLTKQYKSGENLQATSHAPKLSRADVAHHMLSILTDQQSIKRCLMLMP